LRHGGLSPDPKSQSRGNYEVKVDGEWIPVPEDKIINVIAPDSGAHICAPRDDNKRLLCVILPSEG
jgi:hypothetical protein